MTLSSLKLSSAFAAKTMNAKRTMIRGGQLVCIPFETSSKPFRRTYSSSVAFGAHDPILNPSRSGSSCYKSVHCLSAVTSQSAGTARKLAVPYKMGAARSRVRNDAKRLPPPFVSTLQFEMGVVNKSLHPFRTTNAAASAGSTIPMSERLGFTNAAITSDVAKRLHKPLYAA